MVVTRRDMNLMATVRCFTRMNQPQQVGRTDNKCWRLLCIVYLLVCNDVVACWAHAASNDIQGVPGGMCQTSGECSLC